MHKSIMAFDFGERRIGVAVGNTGIGMAHGIATLAVQSRAEQLRAIAPLVQEWQPQQFVVGQPRHADGAPHPLALLAKKFGNRLSEQFKLPVDYVDETLSSAEASAQLSERGIRGLAQKPLLDALAAQIILQSWLDQQSINHAA